MFQIFFFFFAVRASVSVEEIDVEAVSRVGEAEEEGAENQQYEEDVVFSHAAPLRVRMRPG